MSLPTITGVARIVTDPRRGMTKTNKPWCNCLIRFVGYRKDGEHWVEDSSYTATLVAFEDVARDLATFGKGDEIAVEGRLRNLSVWTPDRGEPRAQLDIAALSVTRPERRAKGTSQADAPARSTSNRREPAARRTAPSSTSNRPARTREEALRAAVLGRPANPRETLDADWPAPGPPNRTRGGAVDLDAFRQQRGRAAGGRAGRPDERPA